MIQPVGKFAEFSEKAKRRPRAGRKILEVFVSLVSQL